MPRADLRTRRLSKDNAYYDLKQKIIYGELQPDQIVREENLASLLEISRTPLREAIQRLEIEEFLVRQPNGRLKVASISNKEVEEIFLARSMLEGYIARHAAKNVTDKDIYHLTSMLEKIRLGDSQEIVSHGFEFHDYLCDMSDLKTFEKILNMLKDHAIRYCRIISMYGDWNTNSDEEHRHILQQIIARDEDGAELAMREHILSSLSIAINRIKEIEKQGKE